MPIKIPLAGKRFGRLVVIADLPSRREGADKKLTTFCLCDCDCGKQIETRNNGLTSGHTKSCGCYHSDVVSQNGTTHGCSTRSRKTPEYSSWVYIYQRCHNPKHRSFAHYGGRGIRVCARWRSFENFYADMGPRPRGTSLDRWPDNNGNYEPSNCRWATQSEQKQNTRANHNITLNGHSMCVRAWERKLGFKINTVSRRLRNGWSVTRALTTPVRRKKP